MDNKCNNSESEDLCKTVNNVEGAPIDPKTISRCESPVFRCFNQNKTNRVRYSDSSDYDIPSYQINQSVKRRNSSKHDSEKSDSILPFTPTFSPILTFSQQFQPPSIHSLGTVHKTVSLEEKDKTKISDKSLCDANKEEVKKRNAFESLGMMDKDISWISSMATPTPHIPGSEFNTVEKATFFPDEKFQNIQPRALFSPTFDDDFGCIPLSFSSESEGDESYRSNIRLSDVCATLKKLEVESSEQIPNASEKSLNEENDRNCKTSPVIKMRKQKKYESLKKKKKQASAMSPELIHNCKFSTNENLGVEIVDEKLESNEVNNAISLNPNFMDDDSFQNISFTYIDELCKTLVNKTEQPNCSSPSKTCEIKCDIVLQDKTNLKLPSKQPDDCIEKQFYKSKLDPDICAVSSLDNLHSYAQALEDGNGDIPNGRKIDKSVTEKGVVRFDAFAEDSSATFAAKRLHSELSVEKREIKITEKKFKKEDDESPKWSTMSKYPIECQLNVSDSEIIKTVEKLEKTISSQENKVSSYIKNEVKENTSQLSIDETVTSSTLEKSPNLKLDTILDLKGAVNPPKPTQEGSVVSTSITFKTASGSEIAVAEDALVKGKQVLAAVNDEWHLKQTSDELAKEWMEDFQDTLESFSSYGDKVGTVQNKMDTLVLPDVTGEDSEISEVLTQDKEALVEFNKSEVSFQNINGREASTSEVESKEERMLEESNKVQISSEALKKTRSLMSECEGSFKSENELMKGFSTASGTKVNVSSTALEKARALMSECEGSFKSGNQLMKGFSTASGSKVSVSSAALKKARALMSECEGSFESGNQLMKGFSTASGSKVNVSSAALEKARALMSECEGSFDSKNQLMKGFSTASGSKVNVSSKALEKAKALMSECEGSFESGNQSMKGFSTAAGSKVNVSSAALEKARALMSECEGSFDSKNQLMKGFSTAAGSKVNVSSAALEKARALMSECEGSFESGNQSMKGFSTASGSKVNVSSAALEKARALMSECEGSSKRICDNFVNDWMENFEIEDPAKSEASIDGEAIQKKPPPVCFSTASGSKVTVSEEALKKARESLAQVQNQKSPDNLKNFFSEKPDIELGSSKNIPLQEEKWEISSEEKNEGEPKPENSKMLNDLTVDEALLKEANQIEDDSEGIIPSWLHVYNTSPSFASDRVEMSPLISHEDGKSSNYSREYIVKSPVLGLSDRFYKKGKKRKREVTEEEAKVEPSVESKNFVVPYKNGGKKTGVKRSSLNCSMDFSAPFKKGKFLEGEIGSVEEVRQTSLDIRESRMKARVNQENAIKEKNKIKPLKGSHLQKKCSQKQIKWMEAVENSSPGVYTDEFLKSMGVKEDVLRVNVVNAGDFKFNGEDFYGSTCANNVNGIPSGDGCFIIPDEENKFGVEEVKRAFLASPGVQPNLIPDGWVENHYKWLVWKFSHYERSFPRFFGGRCLNPNNVMLQLKYRYDREIDKNERSALKKILERDDTSAKRMVLCVCGIKKVTGEKMTEYELNLTDGWYSCPARCDSAMTRLIEEGKLPIGMKLVTQGAVLVNCEQGTTPLEMSGDVHLKIFTNSTRRVRWDTKLGFQKNPFNLTISLGSILPQGGQISRIDVIVGRIYPVLYMEKTLDGLNVTRNLRSEEKADSEYRRVQEQKMKMIHDEVWSEMSKNGMEETQRFIEDKNQCSQNDYRKQNDLLNRELLEKVQAKLKKENLNRRNVSEFLKMKIVDYRKPDYNNPAILSVWNPNEEIISLFSEGKVMSLMNVTISNSSRTYKWLQINTTRQTQYKEIVSKAKYPARKLSPLEEVASKISPVFEEVDLVGIVIVVKDLSCGSRSSQIVYLGDLDFHFVGILFWGNCKEYGWENVLKVGSIVACSNLQWKKSCSIQEVPSLRVNETTVFTENPKHSYLKEEIERLRGNMPEDKNTFLTKCEEKLWEKLEESKWQQQGNSSRNSSSNDSTLRDSFSNSFRHINGFESKPTASSTPIKPFSLNLKNSTEAEPSPIQKRIEKLKSYGEPPPPLIPFVLTNGLRKYRKKSLKN